MNISLELAKFNLFTFEETEHSYYLYDKETKLNKKLKDSVTKVVGEFTQSFDADKWSKIKAAQQGVSQKQILKEWNNIKNKAGNRGTNLHRYLELKMNNKIEKNLIVDEELKSKADKFYEDIYDNLIPIKSEIIVGDVEYELAGMVDQLFYSRKHDSLLLFDWKTNKKMEKINEYGNKMLPPFDFLADCNYCHYSLQLGIYKHLLEKNTSLKIPKCYIVWFGSKEKPYEIIETVSLKDELIREVLLNRKKIIT